LWWWLLLLLLPLLLLWRLLLMPLSLLREPELESSEDLWECRSLRELPSLLLP
jgi:hypothetical protein